MKDLALLGTNDAANVRRPTIVQKVGILYDAHKTLFSRLANHLPLDCQKKHWAKYKRGCRTPDSSTPNLPHAHMATYFKDLGSESETFTRLIDCFRLRCDDDYMFDSDCRGIYREEDPGPIFLDFLVRAKNVKMLPDWWNADKENECMSRALKGTDGWADINRQIGVGHIVEHYGEVIMVTTLRMAAERIYNGGPALGWWEIQLPLEMLYDLKTFPEHH